MVRKLDAAYVLVTGDDIERLAARVTSLSANLQRFCGLPCRFCNISRDSTGPLVELIFEVPLSRRISNDELRRVEGDVVRWTRRWFEKTQEFNETSSVVIGRFDEFLSESEVQLLG
jgi:hypothetical protein